MIIDTITCHNVYNYGASLQAYALQHYLESLGHEVKIIDFQPWFHRDRYNPFFITPGGKLYSICKTCPPLKYILVPLKYRSRLISMVKTWGRKKAFDDFTKQYLSLTCRYNTSEELKANPPHADVYIAGSDQIWNTESYNGKEPGYFLDFGTVKKISYAASFAVSEIQEEWCPFVKRQLSHFQHISVREKTGLSILKSLGIQNGAQVVDPVFLLSAEEWKALAHKAKGYGLKENNYIVVYDFLNDERIAAFAKKLKEQTNMTVVSINDFNVLPYVDININDAGPLEFVSLISKAATVVCSSFHASAFSLIFKKPFYVFPLIGQNNSSRMEDLLNLIGHHERFMPGNILDDMDYHAIQSVLDKEIGRSKDVLRSFINS